MVVCEHCQAMFDERDVHATDIEEDLRGFDLLTFRCPKCGKETKSHRTG